MPVGLICLDVDGTLVGSSGAPSEQVWAAADRARSAGIHLAICTARPAIGLAWEWARRLDPSGWHMFQTGASLIHTGRLAGGADASPFDVAATGHQAESTPLPFGVADLFSTAAAANGWVFECYSDTDYVVEQDAPFARDHAALMGLEFVQRGLSDLRGAPLRVQIVTPVDQVSGVLAMVPDGCAGSFATSPVMPNVAFISVTDTRVSKATGVLKLGSLYGVDPADTMMVGDGHNDLSAMGVVGHSVAMANAEPEVLSIARHHVPHVDAHGAAEAIDLATRL